MKKSDIENEESAREKGKQKREKEEIDEQMGEQRQ